MSFFAHKEIYVVIVSGVAVNPCGHTLINFGGTKGFYAHVDGWIKKPWYMTHFDCQRYMRENEKTELWRQRLNVPQPERAFAKLEQLLSLEWHWGGVVNNCATFVEEIVNAGGANFHIKGNCPTSFIPVKWYD
jgi:hypothetical protein